jgi:hypothetical protein
VRQALRLSRYHPQCYFDLRYKLDASLVGLTPELQGCLREAARWSTALTAQEFCELASQGHSKGLEGLNCNKDGVVSFVDKGREMLGSEGRDEENICSVVLDKFIEQESEKRQLGNLAYRADDCRNLDAPEAPIPGVPLGSPGKGPT